MLSKARLSSLRGQSSVSQARSFYVAMGKFAVANIMARLLIDFATRQGNSYVNVVDSDGDWKYKRFVSLMSRKIPTRIITQPGMDKERLPKSQVEGTQ